MKNSWMLTTLAQDRKNLTYIYLCSCSNIVYKEVEDESYICKKCKNTLFIDVNKIDQEYRNFKFEMREESAKDRYMIEYYFEKPYIDAKSNKLMIDNHTLLKVAIDYENNILVKEKEDLTILEYDQIHNNRFIKIRDIIFEQLLPILIKKYFIPKFDRYNLTYHIPDDCSITLKNELVDFYNDQCKKKENI